MIKRHKIIYFFLFLPILLFSQDDYKTIGGEKNDIGYSIALTPSGEYLITGTTRSRGGGSEDQCVVKMGINGEINYENVFGGVHQDYARKTLVLSDGSFIVVSDVWDAGFMRKSILLTKFSSSGMVLWSQFYGDHGDNVGFSVLENSDKSLIVLGYSLRLGGGDITMTKTDADGNMVWEKNFGTTYNDYGFEVIHSRNNDGYIVVGSAGGFFNPPTTDYNNYDSDIFVIKTDLAGNEIWRSYLGGENHDFGRDIIVAPDSGYFVVGTSLSYSASTYDVILIKINEDGEEIWHETYGTESSYEFAYALVNVNNDLFITGYSNKNSNDNAPDGMLLKTDIEGNLIWEKTIGGINSDYFYDLIYDPVEERIITTGYTNSYGLGGKDMFVVQFDTDGNTFPFLYQTSEMNTNKTIQVYPIPCRNELNFRIVPVNSDEFYSISIFNSYGVRVYAENEVNNVRHKLDLSNLVGGMYFYRIDFDGNISYPITGKFIKISQ